MKKRMATTGIGLLCLCGAICLSGTETDAATSPALNVKSASLVISVGNGNNTYGHIKLKIKNKKRFTIKKISYKSKNELVAIVSDKGNITAQSPGKTKITATIKYKNKSKKNSKLKKKKITVPVTIKSKYLLELPKTDMQYDENGKAKPIYPFTFQEDNKGKYSNEASYIDRFPVYVETDYDTDQDGKRDLIMAYVQVPRSAVKGYYKAPVIMEAIPYLVKENYPMDQMIERDSKLKNNAFDYNLLMNSPAMRVPKTEISTEEAVSGASAFINSLAEKKYEMCQFDKYKYYSIRGYASVISPGIGGSDDCEGLQCCGEKVEALAYAAIVEWLHGDRNGYADKEGTKLLRADWCNGHTAMTGLSYDGTMAYEVSTTGVKGLDTVIPCSAVASWYNYIFNQGAPYNICSDYMSYLGDSCAMRFIYKNKQEEKKDPIFKTYMNYLMQKSYDSVTAEGVFGDYWARFEFSDKKPTIPALLVAGLNDINVHTKHAELMRRAYVSAGCPCKVIYHQGRHDVLSEGTGGEIKVGEEYYDELVNMWLAHYMAGIDNGIDKMKNYTIQSNIDGSWRSYDEVPETEDVTITPSKTKPEETVSFNSKKIRADETDWTINLKKEEIQRDTKGMHAVWEKSFDEDTTLNGIGEIHLRVKMPRVDINAPSLFVQLIDENDKAFPVYTYDSNYATDVYALLTYIREKLNLGEGIGDYYEMAFLTENQKEYKVAEGAIDLRMPGAGWEPATAVAPEEPIKEDTYYDYTVYLDPTVYTFRKGHKLKLYIIGLGGGTNNALDMFRFVDKYKDPIGWYYTMASKYDFTVDNTSSYAKLPIEKK